MASESRMFYPSRLWLLIGLYILSIYASLPYMRGILNALKSSLGIDSFSLVLDGALALGATAVLLIGWFKGPSVLAIVAIPILTIGLITINLSIPEERVHFLQYGLLGIMVSATARSSSLTLLVQLALFAMLIGTIDEFIQWLLPSRVGDPRDVAFNVIASTLGIWIGRTLFPPSSPSSC